MFLTGDEAMTQLGCYRKLIRSAHRVALMSCVSFSMSCVSFLVVVHAQTRAGWETVEVGKANLVFSGDAAIGAFDLELSFDANQLRFEAVELGPAAANGMLTFKEIEPGKLKVAVVDADAITLPGAAFSISFAPLITEQSRSEISIDRLVAHDAETLLPVTVKHEAGKVLLQSQETVPIGTSWALIAVGLIVVSILIAAVSRKPKDDSTRTPVN
jgi:hypothetical protein